MATKHPPQARPSSRTEVTVWLVEQWLPGRRLSQYPNICAAVATMNPGSKVTATQVELTGDTPSSVGVFLSGLKFFYRVMRAQGYYAGDSPLVDMAASLLQDILGRLDAHDEYPRMPAISGVAEPSAGRRLRRRECQPQRPKASVESPDVWALKSSRCHERPPDGFHRHCRDLRAGRPEPVAEDLRMALQELLRKAELNGDVDFLGEGVRVLAQKVMEIEAAQHLGAERYERIADRTGERNGYWDRTWDTRVGSIEFARTTCPRWWLLPDAARAAATWRARLSRA